MNAVIGVFATYEDATGAVRDLEAAGIMGEQVEIITDVDEDAEIVHEKPETSKEARESNLSAMARTFGVDDAPQKGKASETPGEIPDYLGDEDFYATHVKQGGAVVIVRPPDGEAASRATAILRSHDAKMQGDEPETRGRASGTGKA